jgi:methyl-accepting chemotaxis protein
MQGLLGVLSILDARAFLIIGAILATLLTSIIFSLYSRGRYAALARDLAEHSRPDQPFSERVLTRILADARNARQWHGTAGDHQASIEQHFHAELGGLLLAERFVRAAPGLTIIFALVGTFYGLALSIGKLVGLVSGGPTEVSDVAAAMTRGLTEALSGMSVAFSTSLFGIGAAVILTLFNVFVNVTDRRLAVMSAIEAHLDRVLGAEGLRHPGGGGVSVGGAQSAELDQIVAEFGQTVQSLQESVGRFDEALQNFAATTRDFREFNLHLKDNVQRMSLSFADLSETLRGHAAALTTGRGPR